MIISSIFLIIYYIFITILIKFSLLLLFSPTLQLLHDYTKMKVFLQEKANCSKFDYWFWESSECNTITYKLYCCFLCFFLYCISTFS